MIYHGLWADLHRTILKVDWQRIKTVLIHHTVPPAALTAVVPPCGVWLIRPQSSHLAVLHPAPC